MKTALLTLGAFLIGAPALAGEPLVLDAEQLDQVTAGSHSPFGTDGTAIIVITPNGYPNARHGELGPGEPGLNLFLEHPGADTETYVVPGAGAATHNPGGEHGNIPQPD
jgi:hypothetical protein